MMGFFDNIFKDKQAKGPKNGSLVQFGHYSDNNKTAEQIDQWGLAETHFHEGKYISCAEAFLKYVKDPEIDNVQFKRNGNSLEFTLTQGSKKIYGTCTNDGLYAYSPIATMLAPSIPAMRKLLELNHYLSYSRFALDGQQLKIVMDCTPDMMHPNKLYFGLRELAIQADLQDDLLLSSFEQMQEVNSEHVVHSSAEHKRIKYQYFKDSINEALSLIEPLNPDTFSNAISYILLNLLQKLDYLIVPEGKLFETIDKINDDYWTHVETKTPVQLNNKAQQKIAQLLEITEQDFGNDLRYSLGTFSKMPPPNINKVIEVIHSSLQLAQHFKDTNQIAIAQHILMYALTNAAYHNSLPQSLRKLIAIYMQVNESEYCAKLGITNHLYNAQHNTFSKTAIATMAQDAVKSDTHRYPQLKFNTETLRYSSLIDFNFSFLTECSKLNFSNK